MLNLTKLVATTQLGGPPKLGSKTTPKQPEKPIPATSCHKEDKLLPAIQGSYPWIEGIFSQQTQSLLSSALLEDQNNWQQM